jgi:hypothetical protein
MKKMNITSVYINMELLPELYLVVAGFLKAPDVLRFSVTCTALVFLQKHLKKCEKVLGSDGELHMRLYGYSEEYYYTIMNDEKIRLECHKLENNKQIYSYIAGKTPHIYCFLSNESEILFWIYESVLSSRTLAGPREYAHLVINYRGISVMNMCNGDRCTDVACLFRKTIGFSGMSCAIYE